MHCNAGVVIILVTLIFPLTLITTYSISLSNKHVKPFWPYISSTGNEPPESCFFSAGLSLTAGLYALIVFIRYVQVQDYLSSDCKKLQLINKSSLCWGLIAAFTLTVTSSFQQGHAKIVHVTSAVICSYAALIYFWHLTYLSHVCPRWTTRFSKMFRFVLCVFSTIFHVIAIFLYLYRLLNYPLPIGKATKRSRDIVAKAIYLTGSFMEWSIFILNELYISSLYFEFTRVRLKIGAIVLEKMEI